MKRIAKHAGIGNIVIEEAPIPPIGPRQALIRNHRTLISRGSEIGRRYLRPEEIDPAIMGYSAAGTIEALGAEVTEFALGQRVTVQAPHAEYVVGNVDPDRGSPVTALLDDISFDLAPFHGLTIGAMRWAKIAGVQPGDTVVVLGQGLVGSLVLQALRPYRPARLIAVDTLPLRCDLAARLGAHIVINAAADDPIRRVVEITGGKGADVVIDCVGGAAGVKAFAQTQEMCRDLGRIHLISLYHGEPLPLDSSKIQRKILIGGYFTEEPRSAFAEQAMVAIRDGLIQVEPMITHCFSFTQAKEAFDLLYHRPGDALGVLFTWN